MRVTTYIFSLPERSSGRGIALPRLWCWYWLELHLNFYVKVFLCDGQGADGQAILSCDRSCYGYI